MHFLTDTVSHVWVRYPARLIYLAQIHLRHRIKFGGITHTSQPVVAGPPEPQPGLRPELWGTDDIGLYLHCVK